MGTCTCTLYILECFEPSNRQQRPAFSATIGDPIRQVSQARLKLPRPRNPFVLLSLLVASALPTCDGSYMIRDDSWPCDTPGQQQLHQDGYERHRQQDEAAQRPY